MNQVTPRKSLGQNFLRDKNVISKIIKLFNPEKKDIVLEIGPGLGALTGELINKVHDLHAVEIDRRAVQFLNEKYPKSIYKNFNIYENSILDFDLSLLMTNQDSDLKIKVIGNIPYNLSSEILFYIISNRNIIVNAQLMVQKEVAQRFIAKPDSKEYGITTIAINLTGSCKKIIDVPPSAFYPSPRVNSSVINIVFEKTISEFEYNSVMNIVRTVFNQRRKQLKNTLSPLLFNYLKEKSGEFIEFYQTKKPNFFQLRPENLSSGDFYELYQEIKNFI